MTGSRNKVVVLAACLAAAATGGGGALVAAADDRMAAAGAPDQPNIVLVMTDDMRASDLDAMPNTRRLLGSKGTTFPNYTTTLPSCCPSRITYLRGQYGHNHTVGYSVLAFEENFRNLGLDDSTIATWTDDAGYRTGLVGKYLNEYQDPAVPPGWDYWRANFLPEVWAETYSANGRLLEKKGSPDHTLARFGERFIKSVDEDEPFFLWQNFNAPHTDKNEPPPASDRDLEKFEGETSPRTGDFNNVNSGMPPHFQDLPPLSPQEIEYIDEHHRARLASLQVVDRAVEDLVENLRREGVLDETYIFFTSDNGYHLGQRRLLEGKMTPLVPDIRVPLLVRGPGVPEGVVREELVQNTDFAPTVADIAGTPTPGFVDGRSILPLLRGQTPAWRNTTLFQGRTYLGAGPPPKRWGGLLTDDGYQYIEYPRDYFAELYDMNADPAQLNNLIDNPLQAARVAILSERLSRLRECRGNQCRTIENE